MKLFNDLTLKLYDRREGLKISILKNKIFIGVFALKILTTFFFASDYLVKFFSPFVNYFILSGFKNPYEHFYSLGFTEIFPYPAPLLWLLSVGKIIFSPFASISLANVANVDLFAMRLPVLIADLIIFIVLIRWLKYRQQKVLYYYWCSPILFYINYLHGQLDVISMAFLFVSLYLLFKEKFYRAMILFGLAICMKTGIVIAFPFIFVYFLYKKFKIIDLIKLSIIPFLLFGLLNINYLFDGSFFEIVFNNKEQLKVFDFNYRFTDYFTIYFLPLAFLLLFVKSLSFKNFNPDLFLMFLGFSFGILTLFIPPMQGWYYWVVPFFIYFFIKQNNAPKINYILLNIFYFAYFLVIDKSDIWQIFQPISAVVPTWPNLHAYILGFNLDPKVLVNIVFTFLQASLLLNIIWLYRKGIESVSQYKIVYESFLIGVAGDSGSGKSHFSNLLIDSFGDKNTLLMEGDDMHKWERDDKNWENVTHLNPSANHLHQELNNLTLLKQGREISRPFYNHETGKFTEPVYLKAKKINIVQGLHSLYLSATNKLFDFKIFIKPHEDLRIHWKIVRDIMERDYSKEKVIDQLKKREADSTKFIQGQEKFADLVVSFYPQEQIKNIGDINTKPIIFLKLKFINDIDIDKLLNELNHFNYTSYRHYYEDDYQYLEFFEFIPLNDLDSITYHLYPEMRDILKHEIIWNDGFDGLLQMFVLYCIFNKVEQQK